MSANKSHTKLQICIYEIVHQLSGTHTQNQLLQHQIHLQNSVFVSLSSRQLKCLRFMFAECCCNSYKWNPIPVFLSLFLSFPLLFLSYASNGIFFSALLKHFHAIDIVSHLRRNIFRIRVCVCVWVRV